MFDWKVIILKYILKNFCSFFRDSKLVAVLAIVSVFVSSIVINFSYGLYQNYNVIIETDFAEGHDLMVVNFVNAGTEKEQYVNKKMLMECVEEVARKSVEFRENVLVFSVNGILDGNLTTFSFGARDGHISISDDFVKNCRNNSIISGDYWTDIDELEGNKVVLCYDNRKGLDITPYTDSIIKDEDTLVINGDEYKIIGYQTWNIDGVMVPINSVADDTCIEKFNVMFDRGITKDTYDCIAGIFKDRLGDLADVREIPGLDNDARFTYRTVMIIAVLTTLISSFNFMILYRYILSQRKKNTAIYRLCGLSATKAIIYNLVECIMITIPVYFVGLCLYKNNLIKLLDKYFPYMREAYTERLYLVLFAIYLLVSVVVCLAQICRYNHKKVLMQKNG